MLKFQKITFFLKYAQIKVISQHTCYCFAAYHCTDAHWLKSINLYNRRRFNYSNCFTITRERIVKLKVFLVNIVKFVLRLLLLRVLLWLILSQLGICKPKNVFNLIMLLSVDKCSSVACDKIVISMKKKHFLTSNKLNVFIKCPKPLHFESTWNFNERQKFLT